MKKKFVLILLLAAVLLLSYHAIRINIQPDQNRTPETFANAETGAMFMKNPEASVVKVSDHDGIMMLAGEPDELILVEEPERGKDALKAKGFSATLSDIVAVTLPHKIGALQETLHILYEAGINIEYMYALCTTTDEAAIAIKPSDLDKAVEALEKAGAHFFDGLFK